MFLNFFTDSNQVIQGKINILCAKAGACIAALAAMLLVMAVNVDSASNPANKLESRQINPDAPGAALSPVWSGLASRLKQSGISGPRVNELLAMLPPTPTQSPMGRKVRELYARNFLGQKQTQSRDRFYKGVVTQANAELCRQFIHEHQAAFNAAMQRYGVSPAIGSALLFVETRLGRVLGDIPENAFITLASMAVSANPQDISQWLPKLPGYQKHLQWLHETMRQRSDWAFREFRALVEHMLRDNIPPERLPGSIYGAVGLCQFMPSNISVYGADGDGDGRVDLFNASDAIASLSNYLAMHGWKRGISPEREHQLLMTYNHSTVYANTIIALSRLVNDPGLSAEAVMDMGKGQKRGKKK